MIKNSNFFRILTSKGTVTEEALQRLRKKYQEDAFAILIHLVRRTASQKDQLGKLWGDSLGVAYVDMKTTLFQRAIVQQLPEAFARKNSIILMYQFGEAVTAAMSNPADHFILKDAENIVGKPISPVFSFPEDIEDAIEVEYRTEDQLKDLSSRIVTDTILIQDITELSKDELHEIAGSQAVIEFVHGLLRLGVKEGASDIHIEPGEEYVRIRFRIDGLLQEKSRLETSLLPPIVSRLKIIANLDITERRRPQDGAIALKLPNRTIDFRFSSVPTIFGEKIVLRILGRAKIGDVPDLSELSFSRSTLDMIYQANRSPHGILFVTGPTGSGKTTTLFSMLKYANDPTLNITTIEEPVEYKLEGINQVQVNLAAELDFASALRAFLRQDPDVMLVGEIRDLETAQIACRAALTGHRVLATMHTNDAAQAVTRLIDIGIEPFIVAPSLIGVMSQRLMRKICDHCRERFLAPPEEVGRLFMQEGREVYFYRGKGCYLCNNTGYSGRVAVHEFIFVDNDIRSLISREAPVAEIQQYARKAGFQSMRYDGIKKVLRGLTTIEEVYRVTAADQEMGQHAF